jgi:hypothetical protein
MADKTCPETLNFPIKLVDWLKSSGSLKYPPFERGRHSSEGDLDSLETVLKKLETTIAERIHSIECELKVLNDFVIKDRPRKRPPVEPEKESSQKATAVESKPAKKKSKTTTTSSTSTKNEGKLHPQDGEKPVISKTTSSKSSRISAKEDSLEKLWNSVDAYFQDIVEDDLLVLEEFSHVDSGLLVVPPLGKHYSAQWAAKDLENEDIADELFENEENDAPSDACGPLTRRLLSVSDESCYIFIAYVVHFPIISGICG